MGYNSTVVIHGDALDHIARDSGFGAHLVEAILQRAVTDGPCHLIARPEGGGSVPAGIVVDVRPDRLD